MRKLNLLFILIIILSSSLLAQHSADKVILQGKKLLYDGFIHYDMSLYFKGRNLFERALSIEPENRIAKYYLAYADYRLSTVFLNKNKIENARKFIQEADKLCIELLSKNKKDVETKALLGSIYGIEIGLEPELAPTLGMKIGELIGESFAQAPDNPRVLLLAGINKLFTPEQFGGNKAQALKLFKKSVHLFETNSRENSSGIDWGYLDALVWTGIAYSKLHEYSSAEKLFRKALNIEPEFIWVKENLLPALKQQFKLKK